MERNRFGEIVEFKGKKPRKPYASHITINGMSWRGTRFPDGVKGLVRQMWGARKVLMACGEDIPVGFDSSHVFIKEGEILIDGENNTPASRVSDGLTAVDPFTDSMPSRNNFITQTGTEGDIYTALSK